MARPTDKKMLLELAETNFDKLFKLIESKNDECQNQEFDFEDRDRNIRDVLIHLYEWQQLLINWIDTNQDGKEQPFLPSKYNWKTYGEMNVEFWKQHQDTSLREAKSLLSKTHKECINRIERFSNEELFTKKYFKWTNTTHLASYCISATSSHYDWAIKKVKNHYKSCNC